MKAKISITILPTILLTASLAQCAAAQQARITLVERNAASSVQAGAQPSVIRKQVPGEPDHEAYRFSQTVHVGSPVTEVVRIAFHQPTTLKNIEASNDFRVASSSCQMGRTYSEGDSCDVSVTLDPKGPGKRAGLLTFTSNESATPDVVGLQGSTLGAALSFIPAQISTVPQTMPGGKPLLYSSWDIATDQGDNLYISDATTAPTNSGKVYFIDGSNALTTLVGGGAQSVDAAGDYLANSNVFLNNPAGIAVDSFLDLYTAEYGYNSLDLTSRGLTKSIAGLGATNAWVNCTSSCVAQKTRMLSPYWVNVDDQQNIYVTDSMGYYNLPWVSTGNFMLTDLTTGNLNRGTPFGLDSSDNLYGQETTVAQCMIDGVAPASDFQWDAAGSGICGFAANNVRSQNAEIGNYISGYAFDAAGDMYFTDQKNNVVRRVDSYNGLIRTVAGNAAFAGSYFGDGGPAPLARLDAPTGVAVDSLGNVYATQIDPAFTSGPTGLVRKIGPTGMLQFPTMLVGQTSAVQTILLTNTGNDALSVSNVLWGGANPGDFIADPATSSCTWNSALASGRSCQLGYTCKPTAAGTRSATITFVDNTATFQNVIDLSCYAISSPVATQVVINPPTSGQVFIAGSTIQTAATVSNNIANPITPPGGTMNMSIINTGTSTTVATFNNLSLSPYSAVSKSTTGNKSWANAPVGNYQVVAAYSGDSLDAAGSATPVPFSVVQVTPTVTITTPANNSKYLPGILSASITVSNSGLTPTAPSPTGTLTVTLTNTGTSAKQTFTPTMPAGSNGKTITSVPLGSLAVGNYTISAAYSGDTADKAATSATNSFSVVQITPTVTVTSPANNSSFMYLVGLTYSAQVSNAGLLPADPNAPTGQVSFTLTNTATSAQTTLGPYTLGAGSNNIAPVSVPVAQTPTVATYTLTAHYAGDTADTAATSPAVTFTITPMPGSISWSTPAAVYQGTALSGTQLNAIAYYNGVQIAGNYVYNPLAGTVMTTVGENTLNVTFNPTDSTDYSPANGSVQLDVLQQIQRPPSATKLSAERNPAAAGNPIRFAAEVTSNSSAAPTGTVSLSENGKVLGSAQIVNGKASVTLAGLAAGTHSLVATYSGDALHGASASEALKQVVSNGGVDSPMNQ